MSRNSNQPCEELPKEGFVRLPTVLRHIPVGKTVWYEGIKTGRFPEPVMLGPATAAWRAQDIRQVIADLEAGRGAVKSKTENKTSRRKT
jgi:predicted DNA-binding transcriptional regulator AlpA